METVAWVRVADYHQNPLLWVVRGKKQGGKASKGENSHHQIHLPNWTDII